MNCSCVDRCRLVKSNSSEWNYNLPIKSHIGFYFGKNLVAIAKGNTWTAIIFAFTPLDNIDKLTFKVILDELKQSNRILEANFSTIAFRVDDMTSQMSTVNQTLNSMVYSIKDSLLDDNNTFHSTPMIITVPTSSELRLSRRKSKNFELN